MHPNPIFRDAQAEKALNDAATIGFGMLVLHQVPPLISHVPFVMSGKARLELHLVRSNPIARAMKAAGAKMDATMVVQGPHAYISPDWYGVEDQVPTWNYIAVHLNGTLVADPDQDLSSNLDQLVDEFEGRLVAHNGKPKWTRDKMDDKALGGMMRAIRPFHFAVEGVESTYKLNQNKDANAVLGALDGLENSQVGSEIDRLCAAMIETLPNK